METLHQHKSKKQRTNFRQKDEGLPDICTLQAADPEKKNKRSRLPSYALGWRWRREAPCLSAGRRRANHVGDGECSCGNFA